MLILNAELIVTKRPRKVIDVTPDSLSKGFLLIRAWILQCLVHKTPEFAIFSFNSKQWKKFKQGRTWSVESKEVIHCVMLASIPAASCSNKKNSL